MKKLFNLFIGSGSILMLSGLVLLIVDMCEGKLNDRSVIFALPLILSGVSVIFTYTFILDRRSTLKHIRIKNK